MAIDLTVEIRGLRNALDALDRVRKRTENLRPVFRAAVDPEISRFFRLQFETAGAYGGEPWTPLRLSTQAARQRPGGNRGGVNRPLWDTGKLRGSLVKVGPESIRVIGRQHYERGTSVPYAIFHQEGAILRGWGGRAFTRPRRLPRRPLVPGTLPPRVTNRLTRAIERFVGEEE